MTWWHVLFDNVFEFNLKTQEMFHALDVFPTKLNEVRTMFTVAKEYCKERSIVCI